jgi:hypothetical protein
VYFPLFLDAELPAAFQTSPTGAALQRLRTLALGRNAAQRATIRDALIGLQARFDHQTRETLAEAAALKQQPDAEALGRLLNSFMQANIERFEEFWTTQIETHRARQTLVGSRQ